MRGALLDLVPAGQWVTTDGLRAYYYLAATDGADLTALYGWMADLAGQGLLQRKRPRDEPWLDEIALLRWRRA